VQSAIAEKKPGMSDLFPMEEGFSGISVTYPIFSDTGTYLGYTDVTIIPEELLSRIIVPIQKDTGMEVFVIQDDGLTLYETNPEEIGRNIISDPLYNTPTMQAATESVMENETGTIRYTFWNTEWNRQVPREATWTTLYYGGQEWRIGVIRNQNDADQSASVIDDFVSDPVIVKDAVSDQIRFVDDAVRFARSVGKEEACRVFNDLSGPYVSKAGYIYAYDKNGTPLALPYQQGLIGTSRINLTDINGLAIMPAMTDLAQEGGGSMYIVYPNPTDNFRNQLKIEYLLPVDAEWFVGSGIYLPEIPAEISPGEISALIDRVNTVASHGYKVGKKEAIQDFNDLNQSFADGGRYIFAYGYDGTTLALPYQPELVGTNRSSFSDAYGSPVLLLEIKAAQRGGGFVYVVYQNPDTGTDELKLCYVLPAGDDWLAGSGIYTGTALAQ
ncbi:MAG: cache domain-containing protein, partial [Methanospirillaceae archaeon]|nr:cache domain-containing protein [Methanospirillaceae archaeon]